MKVELNNTLIEVIIEYKNNKNLYIRIKDDLKMYVTCNRFFSKNKILDVIKQNEKSLYKMYQKKLKEHEDNSIHYYLGKKYTVIFDETIKRPTLDGDLIIIKNKKMLDKFYELSCKKIFEERLYKASLLFDNIPKYKMRIRKMKTRWGVNNRANNTITLNSELIKRDIALLDYVCVHELSHFLQPNHSSKFWAEVESRYPNYKEARKRLNNGIN